MTIFGKRVIHTFATSAAMLIVTWPWSGEESESLASLAKRSEDQFTTMYGRFLRIFEQDEVSDTTNGEFYYLGPGSLFMEVSSPLHQIMIIDANLTTIYYPESRLAFVLESANPVVLPLVPGLMSAIRPDYGLADIGLELLGQEMRGDTLVALWSHPKARDKIGEFRVAEYQDRLIYTQYDSPKSKSKSRTSFSKYAEVNGIFFPTEIFSEVHGRSGSSMERIFLDSLKIDIEVPNRIMNFKIPDGVAVEKKKW